MWQLLSDPEIQRTLAFYGGGAATVIGALWVAWTRLSSSQKSPPPTAQGEHGIAAGRPIQAGGNITNVSTPVIAWIVLALGLLILGAVALFGRGDCIAQTEGTGISACGDVSGSTVSTPNHDPKPTETPEPQDSK
ncbi:hypothetical protein [Paracoccus sp. (in: a-proteobacteria)]|uniref:hypothetical protein n=1 Tax=Paracoccus sp. TaxID=267 RepID=UPI00322019B0